MYRQPKGKYINGELERVRTKYHEHVVVRMERSINIYRKFELEILYLGLPICHSNILTKLESTRPLTSKCSINPSKFRDKTAFFLCSPTKEPVK
jgi:hypothetical protein